MSINQTKVFIEGHTLDRGNEGAATYLKNIYNIIINQNKEYVFYIGSNNPKKISLLFVKFNNVKVIKYKFKNSLLRTFIDIPNIIKTNKINFAHFTYLIPFIKNKNCKYFVTTHDILFEDFPEYFPFKYRIIRSFFFKLSVKMADQVFTISNYSKKRIESVYKLNSDNICITRCAVSKDFTEFNKSKTFSKKYISNKYSINNFILYVSRIEKRKNQSLLLEQFIDKKLYLMNWKLVFIGSDSLKSDFLNTFNSLSPDIKKNIYWLYDIPYKDLINFYNACEFFVYPSSAEGFGIPPLESASLNAPTMCSNQTAMEEFTFFKNSSFNPKNFDEFSKTLDFMINNYKNIETNSIKNEIINKYSWERSANQISSFFKKG